MSATPRRVRVATYNVHACVGFDRRHDPARIARVIQELDADVVALQEFSYPSDIALETRTPVVLTELDSYQCALGPTLQRRENHYGNVLLSRHPIRELQRLDLSCKRREPRGALAVTLDVGGRELHVVATHLGLQVSERRVQIERLLAHIDSLRGRALVVLGDFNDWLPGRSVAHALDRRIGRAARLRSFPTVAPALALDRIWAQPESMLLRAFAHRSPLARRASDHLPVVAEIELTA